MKGKQLRAIGDRLTSMYRLLDKLDRSVERIEIVTVVREPNTSLSADAYNGLRKQVIAAVSERTAHLHQLAQFDATLRAGATPEELASLVREWLGQASVRVVEDPAHPDAFSFVGPQDATTVRVVRPAYVDTVTGRVVSAGIAERIVDEPAPAHEVPPAPEAEAEAEVEAEVEAADDDLAVEDEDATATVTPSTPGGDQ